MRDKRGDFSQHHRLPLWNQGKSRHTPQHVCQKTKQQNRNYEKIVLRPEGKPKFVSQEQEIQPVVMVMDRSEPEVSRWSGQFFNETARLSDDDKYAEELQALATKYGRSMGPWDFPSETIQLLGW